MPPIPKALVYLWRAFHRLSRRRGGNGIGANPISWSEIDAFVRNTRIRLAPWEIEVIEALDDLFLAARVSTPTPPGPED